MYPAVRHALIIASILATVLPAIRTAILATIHPAIRTTIHPAIGTASHPTISAAPRHAILTAALPAIHAPVMAAILPAVHTPRTIAALHVRALLPCTLIPAISQALPGSIAGSVTIARPAGTLSHAGHIIGRTAHIGTIALVGKRNRSCNGQRKQHHSQKRFFHDVSFHAGNITRHVV